MPAENVSVTAVWEINNRPRKRLGWKSPQEKMWQNAALIASKKSCDLN
jgi:IS30 family transposase